MIGILQKKSPRIPLYVEADAGGRWYRDLLDNLSESWLLK